MIVVIFFFVLGVFIGFSCFFSFDVYDDVESVIIFGKFIECGVICYLLF